MPKYRPPKGVRNGGRQKGTKNKTTIERELVAAKIAAQTASAAINGGKELAIEAIERYQTLCEGVASHFLPLTENQIEELKTKFPDQPKKWEQKAHASFAEAKEWIKLAAMCAKERAQYQTPRLQAVMVSMPGQDNTKVIDNEREPVDAAGRLERASKTYLRLVKGGAASAA
jgi:hypothetical protein